MAGTDTTTSSKDAKPPKLPRLADGQRIQKRPLLHPAIATQHSSGPKIIYVSAKSPFISVVKRVRKYLDAAETRAGPSTISGGDRKLLKEVEQGINVVRGGKAKGGKINSGGEVIMKGTGKAIEKVLALAAWWQEQDGVQIRVRTGSVGAVDDIVGVEEDGAENEGGDEESRVRRVSVLEVTVRYV